MNKRNYLLCTVSLFLFAALAAKAQTYELKSPGGNLVATIDHGEHITFKVSLNGRPVIDNSSISLTMGTEILGKNPKVKRIRKNAVNERVEPVVKQKSATIKNEYNELQISYKANFSVVFRAFDEGLAYRFETKKKKQAIIEQEHFELNFAGTTTGHFPLEESLISHYERTYVPVKLDTLTEKDFSSLPALFKTSGTNVLVTESDLHDYPGLFLKGNKGNSLRSLFPKFVTKAVPSEDRPDRNQRFETADYIAKTDGARTFPWRILIVSDTDADLLTTQIPYLLARPAKDEQSDYTWIKPGRVAWDWYNNNNVYGVDFDAGLNNDTYKYFIDFAAKFGIEYVILDEGWTKSTTNIMEYAENIDVEELVAYGKERNVGIILWALWGPLDKDVDGILDLYASWDVKGIKVDFMQRADQYMVNFYERVAKKAIENNLLVDFHGSYKPAGLRRAYPNVISYEGVFGNEQNKFNNRLSPEHTVTLPFTRMVAGPMDFTPGAMVNAQPENHAVIFDRPITIGTRAHQMAMYAIYESPLQMFCASPTDYEMEPALTELITQVPSVWDETKVLQAKVGDYVVMARRNGDRWYIGAMTDEKARTFDLKLSFLGDGAYELQLLKDGKNANRFAEDYKLETLQIDKGSMVKIELARGGGWLGILSPKE